MTVHKPKSDERHVSDQVFPLTACGSRIYAFVDPTRVDTLSSGFNIIVFDRTEILPSFVRCEIWQSYFTITSAARLGDRWCNCHSRNIALRGYHFSTYSIFDIFDFQHFRFSTFSIFDIFDFQHFRFSALSIFDVFGF